ncbi:hypothetical protein KBD13_01185 [Patescibacteria group bacterium]|jgi:uncharacterized membrane protein (DUF106 family)|nr:hypothetical protein [Patescibacteria group bacterium]
MPTSSASSTKSRSSTVRTPKAAPLPQHESWFVITLLAVLTSVILLMLLSFGTMRDTMRVMQQQLDEVSAMAAATSTQEAAR